MFEFSLCLLADSAINLVSDSSKLGLRSGYEDSIVSMVRKIPGPVALYCPPGLIEYHRSSGRYSSHNEDPKITLKDSWNDSSKEEHEESCPIATGTSKVAKIVHQCLHGLLRSGGNRNQRYIDTKPNNELIHYCLQNPPYTYQWAEKTVPVVEGIENDIYSTVGCLSGMHVKCRKTIEDHNNLPEQRKAIVTSSALTYDPEPATLMKMGKCQRKGIDNLMDLISLIVYENSTKYLPQQPFQTSSNTSRANQDNSPRINQWRWVLGGQKEAGVQLNAEQADWKDDTNDESDDQELEAHYMYMTQIQEVTPDPVDNSRPIFDVEPMHKKPVESIMTYNLAEHGDTNITIDSLDICYDREHDDQDDTDDLDQEQTKM
ncbi:hypothetical protein Tco_1458290 [Tanacetum coccineum]